LQIQTVDVSYRDGPFVGYKLYSRDNDGKLQFTPVGGFGNVFSGITDLNKSAIATNPSGPE